MEYELSKGVYISDTAYNASETGLYFTDGYNSANIHARFTDSMAEYITFEENEQRAILKKLFPQVNIEPENMVFRISSNLVQKGSKLEGIKYIKEDGTFVYGLKKGEFMFQIPFLHKENLSLENSQDLEKIKSYKDLEWPSFAADETELAEIMTNKGYPLTHVGRSGFESRNRYIIELPNDNEEEIIGVIGKINEDITAAREELKNKKLALADAEFAQNALDKDAIFSYLDLGGDVSDLHIYNKDKYEMVGSYRLVACQDSRRNISHIYRTLLLDKEKLQNTDKKVIELSESLDMEFDLCSVSRKYGISFKIGRGTYIVEGKILNNVSHLDLDLTKPEDLQKALAQDELSWLTINATSKKLAAKMEARGYVLEHSGRSGFESRNSYVIKTQDGILSPEVSQKMQQDLQACKEEVKADKLKMFDDYFDDQSTDMAKVYAVVETGYNYDLERVKDKEKYDMIAQRRIACTQDYRQGYDHTFQELLINKERIKKDKRSFITFEVPQDMIGIVVGKGGKNIRELEQKYNKRFKVVQSPREKEEQQRKKHQEDLQKLQHGVIKEVGNYVLDANEDEIKMAIVGYMDIHKRELPFIPSVEEMEVIYQALNREKEHLIEEQQRLEKEKAKKRQRNLSLLQDNIINFFGDNFISMDDIGISKAMVGYLKEHQEELIVYPNEEELKIIQQNIIQTRDGEIAARDKQDKAAVEQIYNVVNNSISNYGYENQYELISDDKVKETIAHLCEYDKENPAFSRVVVKTEKEIILLLQKERYHEQEADKKFDKAAEKTLQRFFQSSESAPHGEYFFNSVGKDRRNTAFEKITQRVMTALGLQANESSPLPAIQNRRVHKYKAKVIDFEERYNGNLSYDEYTDSEYTTSESEIEQPTAKEPTLENLVNIWGAGLTRGK